MKYTLEKTRDWIIVRNPSGHIAFRSNTGSEKLAMQDFKGVAGALGFKLAEQGQPKRIARSHGATFDLDAPEAEPEPTEPPAGDGDDGGQTATEATKAAE